MSSIKKLAGQTLWYGVPTILSRFLGYLMNMSLPLIFSQPGKTADLTQVYAIIPFLNIVFTYGMETAYFRYSREKDQVKLYNTLSTSLFISTIFFAIVLYSCKSFIADKAGLAEHPEYITWMCGILFFDTLSTLPFARLRQENKPRKYAFVKMSGIVVSILVVVICMGVIPAYLKRHNSSFLYLFFSGKVEIGYYLIGNLCGSIVTLLLLWSEIKRIHFSFNKTLMKEVMRYSYPLVIVGLGGMINDMLSRLIYQHVVDVPPAEAKNQLGIFANVYRLAVLVTIMIQAFRMAAEPFFFSQAKEENAPKTYARVMKFFVIACCFMFLLIGLYLDVLKAIITMKSPAWGEGFLIVPFLALGNVFLGIYYNISVWYKLTDKNMYGAAITIGGAIITVGLNILLIPKFQYWGAAAATFCCYMFMMIAGYLFGQKYYPVPYAVKKLLSYIGVVVLIVAFHRLLLHWYDNLIFSIVSGTAFLGVFALLIMKTERKELKAFQVIGRFVK